MAKAGSWLETNVTYQGFERIDFDRKKIRKTMVKLGRDVQKEARRLISRRAVSHPGEYPGLRTGEMRRSIKYKVSKPGFLVRIAPYKTERMKDFYPAFVYYGGRKNYMTDALEHREANAREQLYLTLQDALIPRGR